MATVNKEKIIKELKTTGNLPKTFHVVGVGGIGYHVREIMKKLNNEEFSSNKTILDYDSDTLEYSNLARIPLSINSVGNKKASIHNDIYTKNDLRGFKPADMVIDCRDSVDPNIIFEEIFVKMAYNGGEAFSFDFFPKVNIDKVFTIQDTNTYEIAPSYYVTPRIIALLLVTILKSNFFTVKKNIKKISGPKTFNITESLQKIARNIED